MNIRNKLPLEAHNTDIEMFGFMLYHLESEKLEQLDKAISSVPVQHRGFIAKSIKPYLARLDEAHYTRSQNAITKHSRVAMQALFHAVSLTRMTEALGLDNMDDKQSGFMLEQVVRKVFFMPPAVADAFHRDETFTLMACGAAVMVLEGDTKLRSRREYAYIGEQAMLAESQEAWGKAA